jgi:hypothetical protein
MNKLVIIRKVFKILFPELKAIVRYNKNKQFEIILKNVKKTYYSVDTFKLILFIPGKDGMEWEDFINSLFGYCSLLNEGNCVIKYLSKRGSILLTKPDIHII